MKVSRPHYRKGAKLPIRTAHFADTVHDRAITFDIDHHGQMSDHATYAGANDVLMLADTPTAILALEASDSHTGPTTLRTIPDTRHVDLPTTYKPNSPNSTNTQTDDARIAAAHACIHPRAGTGGHRRA